MHGTVTEKRKPEATEAESTPLKVVESAPEEQPFGPFEESCAELDPGMCVFDKHLRLIAWNDKFLEIFGHTTDLIRFGLPFAEMIRSNAENGEYGKVDVERTVSERVELARRFRPHSYVRTRPDGTVIEINGIPLLGGGFVRAYSVITDGTRMSRELADESQAAAEARTELMEALDSMEDGFVLFDSADHLVLCNDRFRRFFSAVDSRIVQGMRYDELLQASLESINLPDNYQWVNDYVAWRKTVHADPQDTYEISLKDGRWLRVSERKTSDGGTVGIFTEITELKYREAALVTVTEKLQVQNVRFDTALNHMIQGLCLFDADQRLVVCNDRYLELYGFSPEVVKPGISLREIMEYSVSLGNYTSEESQTALVERPVHASKREQAVLEQRLSDGRVIAVMHQPMPQGGSVATYEEITQRKRAEEQTESYMAKLERSNQELQEFAYVASHDLQEPLRKIEAFGDRLRAKCWDDIGDDGQMYVDRMQVAAKRMRALINDLLTYSRVSTRSKPFVPVDLQDLVEGVMSDLQVRIEETEAKIETENLPTMDADATQMRQLMQNLLSNALKFRKDDVTPVIRVAAETVPGQVVFPDGSPPCDKYCQITVADNGIGFEQKYADRIFNIFQRLHGRGEYEGTGIGLASCRKIVERHNGLIVARSEPGEGATFVITLPMKQANEESA